MLYLLALTFSKDGRAAGVEVVSYNHYMTP
jgi:hypothetical protein